MLKARSQPTVEPVLEPACSQTHCRDRLVELLVSCTYTERGRRVEDDEGKAQGRDLDVVPTWNQESYHRHARPSYPPSRCLSSCPFASASLICLLHRRASGASSPAPAKSTAAGTGSGNVLDAAVAASHVRLPPLPPDSGIRLLAPPLPIESAVPLSSAPCPEWAEEGRRSASTWGGERKYTNSDSVLCVSDRKI